MRSKLDIVSFISSLIPLLLFLIGIIFISLKLHVPANNLFLSILIPFFLFAIPLLIIGISTGVIALKKISRTKKLQGKKFATLGIIIGIADIILYALFLYWMSSTIIIN